MLLLASMLSRLVRLVRRRRVSGGATAPGGVVTSTVTTPPEQVREYWTDERVRSAEPREQRIDPPTG